MNENKIVTIFENVDKLNGELNIKNGKLNIWEHKNDLGQIIKTTTNT